MSWDGEVVDSKPALRESQVRRLLAMNKALCESEYLLEQVAEIKKHLQKGEDFDARGLWADLSEEEQITLWVAPTYGGIFSTEERNILKYGESA